MAEQLQFSVQNGGGGPASAGETPMNQGFRRVLYQKLLGCG